MNADLGTRMAAAVIGILCGAGLGAWLSAPWYGTAALAALCQALLLISMSIPNRK